MKKVVDNRKKSPNTPPPHQKNARMIRGMQQRGWILGTDAEFLSYGGRHPDRCLTDRRTHALHLVFKGEWMYRNRPTALYQWNHQTACVWTDGAMLLWCLILNMIFGAYDILHGSPSQIWSPPRLPDSSPSQVHDLYAVVLTKLLSDDHATGSLRGCAAYFELQCPLCSVVIMRLPVQGKGRSSARRQRAAKRPDLWASPACASSAAGGTWVASTRRTVSARWSPDGARGRALGAVSPPWARARRSASPARRTAEPRSSTWGCRVDGAPARCGVPVYRRRRRRGESSTGARLTRRYPSPPTRWIPTPQPAPRAVDELPHDDGNSDAPLPS